MQMVSFSLTIEFNWKGVSNYSSIKLRIISNLCTIYLQENVEQAWKSQKMDWRRLLECTSQVINTFLRRPIVSLALSPRYFQVIAVIDYFLTQYILYTNISVLSICLSSAIPDDLGFSLTALAQILEARIAPPSKEHVCRRRNLNIIPINANP